MNLGSASLRLLGVALATMVAGSALAVQFSSNPDLIREGEYLARLGDCVACHTTPGGKFLAGGLKMKTPFGVIHSTNITPDREHGIGAYTFEDFDRAMRRGVARDGHNLYPAMPYPSFAKIAQDDMRALYTYLMHGVAPVSQPNKPNEMRFPFNIRLGLAGWNRVFLDDEPFRYDSSHSPQWNRGAYIVEGLGHCGSCHTPRGIGFQEKAMSDAGSDGKYFLAGADVEHWRAVNLRNIWTGPEIAQFLKTGQNNRGTAYGGMAEVVHFSPQHFTPGDLAAIGEYIHALSPNPDETPGRDAVSVDVAQTNREIYASRAGLGYVQFCATCHQTDGKGATHFFPPLAGNTSIQAKDSSSLIHVMLSGSTTPLTASSRHAFTMPSYAVLGDQEIAEIATFARTHWGNKGSPVTADQVHKMREALEMKPVQTPEFNPPRYADMLKSPNAGQLIYGMRLMRDTKRLLPNYVGNGLNCDNCHINGGTMAFAAPYVGVAAQFPSYNPRAGHVIDFKDRVNGCMLRSMAGKPLDKNASEMKAMVAYMDWIRNGYQMKQKIPGRGVGKISHSIVPNAANGKEVYENSCAVCHGTHGEGIKRADGSYLFPPLWGNDSYNIGAGIAKTYTAAAFAKNVMPLSSTFAFPIGQGGLTDQQAVDVGEYFSHMPRRDFPAKVHDWPKGGKPSDSRY